MESDERKKPSDPSAGARRVGLPQVARVLSEVYGDRMASPGGGGGDADGESFPLQQKLLVCCLLLLTRSGRSREVVLGKVGRSSPSRSLSGVPRCAAGGAVGQSVTAFCFSPSASQLHEVYSRLCQRRQVSAVGQGECLSLCGLLESRGIFSLKKAKEARLTKVPPMGERMCKRGVAPRAKRLHAERLFFSFHLWNDVDSRLFLQVFLKIEEKDVENSLKDRVLLGSILAAGLPS